MKNILILLISILIYPQINNAQNNLHQFKAVDIDGKEFDFSTLKGKKVLIVNVASKCGLTNQYEELEKLYGLYANRNFIIIAFPANNFGNQEPGTDAEIKEFCSSTYGVTFPVMSKIDVVGENKSPIYKWLTEKSENGKFDAEVKWNFQKFMVDENGELVDFAEPRIRPMSDKIINWIRE